MTLKSRSTYMASLLRVMWREENTTTVFCACCILDQSSYQRCLGLPTGQPINQIISINLWSPDSQRKRHFYCHITIVTSNGQHEKPMVSPLTAEGLIAPMDNYTLLSAVPGVGSKYGAVTAPLCNTATNLWQTETEVGLPLHHVMTHLQNQKDRPVRGRRPR